LQLNTRLFQHFHFVTITKIVRCASAIEQNQSSEILPALYHVTQDGAKRGYAYSHRHKHQVSAQITLKIKPVASHALQLDPFARLHIEDAIASADFPFDQDLKIRILRSSRESKIGGLLVRHSQHCHLTGDEGDAMPIPRAFRPQIK
ncbi:MAG: hypothetical protein WAM70_01605, partial [Pyrinomonadaceae bacterium]